MRQYYDTKGLKWFLPEGARLYVRPNMPTMTYRRNGVKYTVTDLRLLHPYGVEALTNCLNVMINDPEAKECTMVATTDITENELEIVADIVTGFNIEAKKGGRNGWKLSMPLVSSYRETKGENGERSITFSFPPAKTMGITSPIREEINLAELIERIVQHERDEMMREAEL